MTKEETIEKLSKVKKFMERLEKKVSEPVKEWLWDAIENIDYAIDEVALTDAEEDESSDEEADLEE